MANPFLKVANPNATPSTHTRRTHTNQTETRRTRTRQQPDTQNDRSKATLKTSEATLLKKLSGEPKLETNPPTPAEPQSKSKSETQYLHNMKFHTLCIYIIGRALPISEGALGSQHIPIDKKSVNNSHVGPNEVF